MKTTLIKDLGYTLESYPLEDLENMAELDEIVRKYEAALQPCIHCGREQPRISYAYRPGLRVVPGKEHPHEVSVECSRRRSIIDERSGCGIQTSKLHAEDDEGYADIKEALRMVCDMWNRRPSDAADPDIEAAYHPKKFILEENFKNEEEAKAFFKRRSFGKPWFWTDREPATEEKTHEM